MLHALYIDSCDHIDYLPAGGADFKRGRGLTAVRLPDFHFTSTPFCRKLALIPAGLTSFHPSLLLQPLGVANTAVYQRFCVLQILGLDSPKFSKKCRPHSRCVTRSVCSQASAIFKAALSLALPGVCPAVPVPEFGAFAGEGIN